MPVKSESQYNPQHSVKSSKYPYEYGYQEEGSQTRKSYVAKSGQNMYNLGGKDNDSHVRKQKPIGIKVDNSTDLIMETSDDS